MDLFTQTPFYNTPGLKSEALERAIGNSKTQAGKILALFKSNVNAKYTPLQVCDRLNLHESSCRRAMHNLCKDGLLKRLPEQIMERYGIKNHLYQLA